MPTVTRRIGLSLGADICWPQCYEDIVAQLKPLKVGRDTVRFQVERVMIEPFELRKPAPYDLVIDRLTHWYHLSREWIKKAVTMDGVYVFNNPWSVQSMEKQTTYCAMMRLGLPIPDTILVPPKDYDDSPDLAPTLEKYAKLFDLGDLGDKLGYPLFMKPYDGGGWVGVSKIDDADALGEAYDDSGKFVMHLQKGIVPYEWFVRCIGIGPQLRAVRYDPSAPLHERYCQDLDFLADDDLSLLEDITLTINAFFGWDFNSCEALLADGVWSPIDFANPCPDSQVTSLHVHFPWVVIAQLKWSLFCAATARPMRVNLDWQPFFEIAERGLPFREQVKAYGDLARERFDSERFAEFCADQLKDVDEIACEYFGTERAKQAVAAKVNFLYPEHEREEFTERFWSAIQLWREREGRPAAG